ncbi:MAG TPA: ATP-grasp domain-containing protein [Pseudonocardiaceae bacterium]|nr:ATP-grasp domain-containing protein [Pseudonocardiaceae bacterium]
MQQSDVFVLGLDEANLAELRQVPHAEQYRFHSLLSVEELQFGEIAVADLMQKAQQQLDDFDGTVDAIVGFWDFPVTSMVPILCQQLCEQNGAHCAPLEAIVKCEHKYWSRLEQQKVIDEHPGFALVDLAGDPRPPAELAYPMWLKPIKGFSSELAFQVDDDAGFADAVAAIRKGIGRVGEPFQWVLDQLELPPEIAAIGGQACLAEEALPGDQVATEGYVFEGEVTVYGVLDSIDYPGSSTFLRHQYPSQRSEDIQQHLADISKRVITQIGLDNSTFSIEFFHDPETGAINLLEINPRHSQSHAALFDHVDGAPNHHAMLSIALGRDPRLPHRQGRWGIAAKWYHRRFRDGLLLRGPTQEEIERVQREIPGVAVHPVAQEGRRLSESPHPKDSYSFELTDIIVAADDEADLVDKYERTIAALRYEFDDDDRAGDD